MSNNSALYRATQTIATLRTVTKHADWQTIYVADADAVFKFLPDSVDADDGETFVQPDDVPAGYPGRWKKTLGNGAAAGPTSALTTVGGGAATTNAYVSLLDMDAADGGGLFLTGSIKNSNVATLTIRETVDGPNFEAPQSVEHDVASGQYAILDTLLGAVGDGVPPYSTYLLEVKSKVADTPTDYVLRAQVIGVVNE